MGVRGDGRKGWTSGASTIWVLLAGGVGSRFALRFGEGLALSGVPTATTSAARVLMPFPGDRFLAGLAVLPGLVPGLLALDPDRALD